MFHLKRDEAVSAKLDRGEEGVKWNLDSQSKREDKTEVLL